MTTASKNIPTIRFKEFEGEWENSTIGKIGDVKMCRRIFNEQTTPSGDIPFYKIGSFGATPDAYISKETYLDYRSKYAFPQKGDILISAAGTIGRLVIYNGEDAYYQDSNIVWIENDNTRTLNQFLYYVLQIVKFNTEGGTIQRLYNNILKSTEYSFPSLPEQQKIASFLTAVDEKIQQLTRKKALLEQYKKGVMQQIFSREIRFRDEDGKEYPEWEEKMLGEVAIKKASSIAANTIEDNTGSHPIYGASGFMKNIDFFQQEQPFIGIVKDGAGVGRTFCLPSKSSVLGTLDIILPAEDINLYFLFQLINQIDFGQYTTGSTIPHIYFKDYKLEKVQVPCIKEQQKIASFLSAFDEKIAQVGGQLDKAKEWKKGLLQGMFV